MRIVTDFEAGCEAAVHFTSPSPLQFDSTPVTLVIDWGRPATWTANVGRNQSCLPEFLFLIYCKGSLKSIQKLWLHTICPTPLFENHLTFPLWKLQKQTNCMLDAITSSNAVVFDEMIHTDGQKHLKILLSTLCKSRAIRTRSLQTKSGHKFAKYRSFWDRDEAWDIFQVSNWPIKFLKRFYSLKLTSWFWVEAQFVE